MPRKPRKKGKTPAKTPEKKAAASPTELVTQPHGGALRRGGTNKGGTGRPPSAIRDDLRGSFSDRVQVLRDIADGTPMQRIRYRPADLAPYLKCGVCGASEFKPVDIDSLFAEITVEASASPRDRMFAIDILAKYGLGALKEVSIENVRERVQKTLDVIQARTSAEQYQAIVQELQPVWV